MYKRSSTRVLVECALMIALSTVLSEVKIDLPMGGGVTVFSMVPIAIAACRHGTKWGMLTAFTYSVLQMFMGMSNVLYCKTLLTQTLCVLLDYIVAYSVLGLTYAFSKPFGERPAASACGVSIAVFIRFICSFLSGILLWGEYAPEGTPVWLYSLTYNGGYMLPELVITAVGVFVIQKYLLTADMQ
ncbi:MAG: energy-coupled thiamine transporter ThiT [Oscillospiraceae bacterium]|nr:energy-coupled thiamine transporter ThiT [Oscillospiraceae bacterium]